MGWLKFIIMSKNKKDKWKILLTIRGRYAQQFTEDNKAEVLWLQKKMMKRGYMGSHVTRVTKIFKNGKEVKRLRKKTFA
jgi:hypothetical protein